MAVGTVQPRYETNLGFRVLGRLIARPVNVGDLVAEGQTIAAIDPTALELAVRSAKARTSASLRCWAGFRVEQATKKQAATPSVARPRPRITGAIHAASDGDMK